MAKTLEVSTLNELFSLNRETGRIFWKVTLGSRAKAGDEAGTYSGLGYRVVQIRKIVYLVHRVIFAMVNNRWPIEHIDHINMVRDDNRPENLREATRAENFRNTGIPSNNTSGVKGVSWQKVLSKWHAYIKAGGKRIHLGFHEDLELAELIVSEARRKYHGEFARES